MSPADRQAKIKADLQGRLAEEVERLARKYNTSPATILTYAQSVLRGDVAKPVSDKMNVGEV